jgi:hypothetical protein
VSSTPGNARISPKLVAQVHWSLGRAIVANAEQAGTIGAELIAAIQKELDEKYHTGVEATRRITPGSGSLSPQFEPPYRGREGAGKEEYAQGASV